MPKYNSLTAPARWDTRCGTEAGAKAHERRGETPCVACKRARNLAQRERRRKKSFRTGLHNCSFCGVWMKAVDHGTVRCSKCGRVDSV